MVKILSRCLDVLIGDTCVLCGQALQHRTAHLLCHFCWAALPRNVAACRHCARPLYGADVCGQCQHTPLTAGKCVAPLLHSHEAKLLIHQLKLGGDLRAGITLAEEMAAAVSRHYQNAPLPAYLVPVPLSYRRQVSRGFNQAAWLAHQVGRALSLPLWYGDLRRRHSPPQRRLSRTARMRLSTRDFHLTRNVPDPHVAVVDDVLTTGATVRALCRQLSKHGALRIDIWCATRAVNE